MTRGKQEVLRVLKEARKPLTAEEILRVLRNPLHKTSLYRMLERFGEEGHVSMVDFGEGTRRFEFIEGAFHHHHAVCIKCSSVAELDVEKTLKTLERTATRQSGFRIMRHQLEFFGLCEQCA